MNSIYFSQEEQERIEEVKVLYKKTYGTKVSKRVLLLNALALLQSRIEGEVNNEN